MKPRIWQPRTFDEGQARVLEHELGVAPVTARLLSIRGLGDLDVARRFLAPSIEQLHDPFTMTDMTAAVDRILGAVARKERIAAIERGIDPEKLPALPASDGYGLGSSRIRRAHGLLIGGLVLLAVGLGMAVVFAFIEPEKSHWVAGVVPGFVGIALLLASRIVWPKEDARPAGRPGETRY